MQIAGNAFADGAALKSILLPDDLLYIGAETFSGCRSLTKVSAILRLTRKPLPALQRSSIVYRRPHRTIASKAFTAYGRFNREVEGIVVLSDTAFEDSLFNSLSLNAVNPPTIIPTEDEETINGLFYNENGEPFDEPKELPGISFPVFETETEEDSPLPFLPSSVTALFIPPEAAAAYRNAPSWKGYRELLNPFSPAKRK